MRQRYRRKSRQLVSAVRLALDFDGLDYRKWGGIQHAKPGDWLVDNGDDVYTVDADTFVQTYQQTSPGRWQKVAPVWAERAMEPGHVTTQEGRTCYEAGDWLVSNDVQGIDMYAIKADKFVTLYELDSDAGDSS